VIREAAFVALLVTVPLAAQQPIDFVARHQVVDAAFSADGRLIGYSLRRADRVRDTFTTEVFVVPRAGGPPRALGEGRAVAFSSDGHTVARLMIVAGQPQLVVRDSLDGPDRVLTALPYGVSAFRFSPDGTRLVLTADASPAFESGRIFGGGDRAARLALFAVSTTGGALRRLTDTDVAPGAAFAEQPVSVPFDWIDDSTLVLSARVTGSGEPVDGATLHLIDVARGTRRDLIGTGGRWVAPVVSPDHRWIAFTGQPIPRGPWSATELLVVRPDGSGLRRLTVGLDRDVADVMWSDDSKSIWFATEDRGTRNLHRIDVGSGKQRDQTTGTHLLRIVAVSRRNNEVLAVRATAQTAGTLVRIEAGAPEELRVVVEPDATVPIGEVEQFEVRSADGTVIDAVLHRPPGFVLGQAAPLLLDLHGGPHAMAGAGYAPWALAHAAAGTLVLRVNPRGSTGYGFDLVNGAAVGWPVDATADLRAALRDVIARGLVDTTRIAAVGTGAGAAQAVALAHAEPLVRRVILRCPDGGWLPGGRGYDAPLWSEWYAARPLRVAVMDWLRDGWLAVAPRRGDAPALVIEGAATEPEPLAFAELMHTAFGRVGVPSRLVRIGTSCGQAGPATQAALISLERDWLAASPAAQ
jgi:dipeptidyl aminopeptidase/acylaminoacyl peptidase